MPIQIKIKSTGADISEEKPKEQSSEDQTDVQQSSKESIENQNPNSVEEKSTESEVKSANNEDEKSTNSEKSAEVTSSADTTSTADVTSSTDGASPSVGESGEQNDLSKLYEYEGEEVFYTDPATKVRYRWDTSANGWSSEDGGVTLPPAPDPSQQQYEFDGSTYIHRDEQGKKFKWNNDKNDWEKQEESEESEEDDNTTEEQRKARQYRKRKAAPGWGENKTTTKDPVTGKHIYTDPLDGSKLEWDAAKNAWVPLFDDEFLANYQLNYGFTNDLESKPTVPEPEVEKPPPEPKQQKVKKTPGAKKEVEPPKWFDADDSKITKVYVSGLGTDVTEKEFEELMAKCGMIEHDVRNKKAKMKLYKDEKGVPKGDGLCSYIKPESVELALTILDGSDFKGNTVSVEKAKFEMKGANYDPKLKPKKLNKREKEKAAKQMERLFAWVPDKMKGERGKNEKVVIVKNLFDPLEFNKDPGLIQDYKNRIRGQCSKFGSITKLNFYDKHEEGICQIFFQEASEADMAIEMLHGRLFGKRLMSVDRWDGKTKYKTVESKEEEKERLDAWEKFLEGEDEEKKPSNDKKPEPVDEKKLEPEPMET